MTFPNSLIGQEPKNSRKISLYFLVLSVFFFIGIGNVEAFSVQEVATSAAHDVLEVIVDIDPVPVGNSYVIPHGHWSFQKPSGHYFGAGGMPTIAELYNEVAGEWTQVRITRGVAGSSGTFNYRVSVITSDFVSVQQNTVSGTTGSCGWDNDVDVSRSFGILQWTTLVTNDWSVVMSKTFELNPGSMTILQALPHSTEMKHCQVIEFQEVSEVVASPIDWNLPMWALSFFIFTIWFFGIIFYFRPKL